MGFYSCWQPLEDEDRHTALVFGFLRHVPVAIGLEPWLAGVLGRPVQAGPLTPQSFWPVLPSVVEGSVATEPELVFEVVDELGRLTVVVEVKPGIGMQRSEQLVREVVDVAARTQAKRVALVTVDPDLDASAAIVDWQRELEAGLASHGMRVEASVHRCSFAALAETVSGAGQHPDWKLYADDVLAQLNRKGLLHYQGAPMLNDLEPLTPAGAVEAFNRVIAAARHFYLRLHADSAFTSSGYAYYVGPGDDLTPRMLRNGRTDKLHQPNASFATTVLLATYQHPELAPNTHAFVAFDLQPRQNGDAAILAGRWTHDRPLAANATTFATALTNQTTADSVSEFAFTAWAGISRWTYDRRPWTPGTPEDDIRWAASRLVTALRVVTTTV